LTRAPSKFKYGHTVRTPAILVLSIACLLPLPAHALQPLADFVAGGRARAADVAEAAANRDALDASADVALGRVLPGVSASGTYTRNQYDSQVTFPATGTAPAVTVTITPIDQLNGAIALNVPLVNLANFWRIKSARIAKDAADKSLEATYLSVESQVVQDYYQLVANVALVAESQRALDVARSSLTFTSAQKQAGRVAELDVERARAEVERNVQQVAAAELQVTLSAQALESLTLVKPDLTTAATIDDDLHPEPPLEQFSPPPEQIPAVSAAVKNRESAAVAADAQRLALVPTLQGSLTESFTNTGGFSGHDASWQAILSLTWVFDYTSIANIHLQDANVRVSAARETRARLAAHDAIVRSFSTVASNIARSRSARAQALATNHAAQLADERYRVGATTQLELLQAQRDAFTADVSRIQADADLVNARAQLRLAAGQDPYAAEKPAAK